ncbi:hypothetical protein COL26b_012388 [Colletotrichum chrysophilum]|uniref:uncharacterized protein n=1 Tax=Colletotrichum chrysophilum TaxID=1836956 RepID=UPI0023002232|nr:uncharacterized protein COL26b_012388 [Colletotrichum chrysophilum]KAJ0364677.1 hypothetical protein COL26b_012388 [Colletotrichum chrysophilum]
MGHAILTYGNYVAGSHSFDIITKGLIEEMMEDYRYNLIGQEMEVFNGLLANNSKEQCSTKNCPAQDSTVWLMTWV